MKFSFILGINRHSLNIMGYNMDKKIISIVIIGLIGIVLAIIIILGMVMMPINVPTVGSISGSASGGI